MKSFFYLFLINLLLIQGCANSKILPTAAATTPLQAREKIITMEGQATIQKGATLLARKLAFQNAIKKVAVQAGGSVSSSSLLGSTKVVDEWVKDDVYHLQVLSVISSGQSCHSPYRKRILATGFPLVTAGQISANETQDLYSGIPREIGNMLMESGDFIGRNETHTILYSRPDMAPEILDQDEYQESIVMQLAEEYGVRFVLSGVIRDLEVESTEYIRGAGLLAQMKSMMRDFVARRGVAIDVYVHDGFSGAVLFQHRYTDTVLGDVWIPTGYTVGSERFKSTPAGHKISKIIKLASQDIKDLFACYPYVAKVINVENNKIYIASGIQDKLKRGDNLVVYATNVHAGMKESQLIGVIKIEDVQAQYSVGIMEVSSDVRKVKAGDLVKSW